MKSAEEWNAEICHIEGSDSEKDKELSAINNKKLIKQIQIDALQDAIVLIDELFKTPIHDGKSFTKETIYVTLGRVRLDVEKKIKEL